MLKYDGIDEALVMIKDSQRGEPYICSYVVSHREIEESELRDFLLKQLPYYMLPLYFVPLAKVPLTPNGKLDIKALPDPGSPRGETYEGPHNPMEKQLVEVWQEVLGIEGLGINDNFSEIGGDSIKSIQIASRMNRAGYKIEIKDIFQYPCIAQLAPHVGKVEQIAVQDTISGPVPLTPIQHEFFQKHTLDPHHYNQSVMLYFEEGLEETAARTIFKKIQEHHDGLRMLYHREKGEMVQINTNLDYPLSLQVFTPGNSLNKKEALAQLETWANEIQRSINLETGPLMKIGLIHLADGSRLLIVIHHLVVDGVSWRVLFEDIEILYRQYKNGEPLILPLKTDSFKTWSEKLLEYADSDTFLEEKSFWAQQELQEIPPLKKDFPGDNSIKEAASCSFRLSKEETSHLLQEVNGAFGTEINDILLTALALGLKKAWGHRHVLVALEGHGREEILTGVNISRTVGWFASIFPVILDVSYENNGNNLARQIKEIKETLRKLPNKGVGYGILKYLTNPRNKEDLNFHLIPQIRFNYLGQFDADVRHMAFAIAAEPTGSVVSEKSRRRYELDVSGIITGNQLTISIAYGQNQFKAKPSRPCWININGN